MTTDDDTAARAAAEDYASTPRMNVGTVRDRIAEAHLAGAAWGREQALAQAPAPIPDEDQMEVVGEWLVVRGVQEPEYPAGPEYGPYPYSDAAPLVHLARVAGYPPEPPEPTDAEVDAAARELASAAALIVAAGPKPWEWWTDRNQARFRNAARAALIRARATRRDEEDR